MATFQTLAPSSPSSILVLSPRFPVFFLFSHASLSMVPMAVEKYLPAHSDRAAPQVVPLQLDACQCQMTPSPPLPLAIPPVQPFLVTSFNFHRDFLPHLPFFRLQHLIFVTSVLRTCPEFPGFLQLVRQFLQQLCTVAEPNGPSDLPPDPSHPTRFLDLPATIWTLWTAWC